MKKGETVQTGTIKTETGIDWKWQWNDKLKEMVIEHGKKCNCEECHAPEIR